MIRKLAFVGPLVLGALIVATPHAALGQGAMWTKLFQFEGTESFRYGLRHQTAAGVQEGSLAMSMSSNGGQPMATVEANLGAASCSSTLPMSNPQAVIPQMMMQCASVTPVTSAMFTPAWVLFMTQSWQIGTKVNLNQGGQEVSFSIVEACSYAGVDGLLGKMVTPQTSIDACVSTEVALPLYVKLAQASGNEETIVELKEYKP